MLYVRTHQSSFCKSHSGHSLFALHTKLTSSLESHEILIHTRSTLRGRATYQKHYPSCIKCIAHIAAADLSVSRETIINEALWFHFPGLEREETPGFPWLWELLSGAGSTSCFLRRVSVIWMFGSCRLSEYLRRSRGAAGFLSGALDGASISSALHHLLANAAALGPAKCHLQPTSLPSLWEVFFKLWTHNKCWVAFRKREGRAATSWDVVTRRFGNKSAARRRIKRRIDGGECSGWILCSHVVWVDL